MTRFARAKGSKASNEKLPEASTSWNEMKKQLLEKNKQTEEGNKKKEADKTRLKNYNAFLQQVEEERAKTTNWAEFPINSSKSKVGKGGNKKGKQTHNEERVNPKIEEAISSGVQNDPLKNVKKVGVTETKKFLTKKRRIKPEVTVGHVADESGADIKINGMDSKSNEVIQEHSQNVKFKKSKVTKRKAGVGSESVKKQKVALNLSEDDLKKIEKKKKKRLRQLEKKKLKKQKSNTEAESMSQQKDVSETMSTQEVSVEHIDEKKKTNKELITDKVSSLSKNKANNYEKQKARSNKSVYDGNPKHERRKKFQEKMFINGREIEIAYVDGFPVKKEDAERIKQLRKQMISKGLPRSEIKVALKLERRRAEKAFAREKKKVCFNCRKSGHNLSECPDLGKQLAESTGTGICFKCGSTEHTHFECKVVRGQEFKYAQCFICHEQGHIARQCPDNARGLYPKGGACKVCGDVTHLKKDCPKYQAQQQQLEQSIQIETINSNDNPDSLGQNDECYKVKEIKRVNKIIKF